MKIHVEMTEEEYDFYKTFKSNKELTRDNLRKLYFNYLKEIASGNIDEKKQTERLYKTLDKYLLTLFEIKEDPE